MVGCRKSRYEDARTRSTLHASPSRKAQRQSESERVQPRVGGHRRRNGGKAFRSLRRGTGGHPSNWTHTATDTQFTTSTTATASSSTSPSMVRVQIKGGVWKNTEDEILKAAISKYGMNVSTHGRRGTIDPSDAELPRPISFPTAMGSYLFPAGAEDAQAMQS